MKILYKITNITFWNLILLTILGGFVIKLGGFKFEWSTLAPWVALHSVFFLILSSKNRIQASDFVDNKIKLLTTPKFFWAYITSLLVIATLAHFIRHIAFETQTQDMGIIHQSLKNFFLPRKMALF